MKKKLKIQNVAFEDDYRLHIVFSTGEEKWVSMKPGLMKARFIELNDMEKFKQGELIEGRIIRWSDTTEITLEELVKMKEDKR